MVKAGLAFAAVLALSLSNDASGRPPLHFEENLGQTATGIRFLARASGHTLLLGDGPELIVRLPGGRELAIELAGAREEARLVGRRPLPGRSHYFLGNDPDRWVTNAAHFAKVEALSIYPGIDVVFYGNENRVEFDFLVSAGADPQAIALGFNGAEAVEILESGDVLLTLGAGELRLRSPRLYQRRADEIVPIEGGYRTDPDGRVGFWIEEYDRKERLVIDPILEYSTYLGGENLDFGLAVEVDEAGSVYVAGQTLSPDFPAAGTGTGTPGPDRLVAYVTKMSATGGEVLYSTFLGGTTAGVPGGFLFDMMDIEVDLAGNAYVTGHTSSDDFPTRHAIQPLRSGYEDAFVAKISPDGSTLVYSTYLGGKGKDFGRGVALDEACNLWVVGVTSSPDFPVVKALQPSIAGALDAFVAKLDPAGSTLLFSTFFGGTDVPGEAPFGDLAYAVAADSEGNAYVTGFTSAVDFPTVGPLQPELGGGFHDAFVAKIAADGSRWIYSTFLGGAGKEEGLGIAVDSRGAAHVTGWTTSMNFPTASARQETLSGVVDAFVSRVAPGGDALELSTYLGGGFPDYAYDIRVAGDGGIYVAGSTDSANFPTARPLKYLLANDGPDAFIAQLTSEGALRFSSFVGGSGEENPFFASLGIDVSPAGMLWLAGSTFSQDLDVVDPVQGANAGLLDAFLVEVAMGPVVRLRLSTESGARRARLAIANGGDVPRKVELKLWIRFPGFGSFSLLSSPAVTTLAVGETRPLLVFDLPAALPFPGTEIGARLLDPATGDVLSERLCRGVPCR